MIAPDGGTPQLPVTPRVRTVARALTGSYYFTAEVGKTHEEIYVVADRADHKAIEAAVPLTTTDSALSGLRVTYALLVGVGIVLAGLIGALVARAALAPIRRFTSETEQVDQRARQAAAARRGGRGRDPATGRQLQSDPRRPGAIGRGAAAPDRRCLARAAHPDRGAALEHPDLPRGRSAAGRGAGRSQEAIIAELDDLTQLVSDVLELARGAAPNEAVEELELDAIVREAIERAVRRSPNLSFETELEPTLINNSPDRVVRAVTNIVDNARKWSPPDGTVEITLSDGVLTVRDHGPGFRTEDLANVFERFYRSADARRMSGSGLGLAIVKQAAEAHGGYARPATRPMVARS